jgi:hypothetical protein
MHYVADDSGTEYVILMNAVRDLILPNPPSAELIAITPLIEEHVTVLEGKFLCLQLMNPNGAHCWLLRASSMKCWLLRASSMKIAGGGEGDRDAVSQVPSSL